MNCLQCGKDIAISFVANHTNHCIECGLETDVFNVEHGWGDYHNRMKYRYNGYMWDWTYIPEGCLAIFNGDEIK